MIQSLTELMLMAPNAINGCSTRLNNILSEIKKQNKKKNNLAECYL